MIQKKVLLTNSTMPFSSERTEFLYRLLLKVSTGYFMNRVPYRISKCYVWPAAVRELCKNSLRLNIPSGRRLASLTPRIQYLTVQNLGLKFCTAEYSQRPAAGQPDLQNSVFNRTEFGPKFCTATYCQRPAAGQSIAKDGFQRCRKVFLCGFFK